MVLRNNTLLCAPLTKWCGSTEGEYGRSAKVCHEEDAEQACVTAMIEMKQQDEEAFRLEQTGQGLDMFTKCKTAPLNLQHLEISGIEKQIFK